MSGLDLTPKEIVRELDRHIVGQAEAKRKVAVALRNRWRRMHLTPELQEDVTPKNILMIGPTGVGKTELARRLAKLVGAPFLKVEATRFTEVGYVGRDVESMVRDLVEVSVRLVREEHLEQIRPKARALAEGRLVELLVPGRRRRNPRNPLEALWRGEEPEEEVSRESVDPEREAEVRRQLREGRLEQEIVELDVEVPSAAPAFFAMPGMEEMGANLQEALGNLLPKRRKRRKMTVAEAREVLAAEEADKLLDQDQITREAIQRAQSSGIIFIDEMDKIASTGKTQGPDVSREGVQRDILPIVEGATVATKYGPVKTDHILFIGAGAFHVAKPSDLIPELQGRFPVRVELKPLELEDYVRILTEPENALLRQYQELLRTDGVTLEVTPDGVRALAEYAVAVNRETEDIGARRLATIVETVLEEVLYYAPDPGIRTIRVDRAFVNQRLANTVKDPETSRYIL
jgi:ATP-dependent HslUV protease ATP-binding subunit HslU